MRTQTATRWLRTMAAVGTSLAVLASGALALADDGHQDDGPGLGRPPAIALAFSDLAGFAWAAPAVDDLSRSCVVLGVGGGRFLPRGDTTREEMAVILDRFLGWATVQGPALPPGLAGRGPGHGRGPGLPPGLLRHLAFADAPDIADWAEADVALAAQAGLLRGEPGGLFVPLGLVTWDQAAVIVQRVFRFPPVPAPQVPAELAQLPQGPSTPGWAQAAVAAEVAAGVFTGALAQAYQPEQPIPRADLAALLQAAELAAARPVAPSARLELGRVAAVGSASLTLQTACGLVRIPVGPNATVYQGGNTTTLAAVAVGDTVLVGLNQGQAVFVDVLRSVAPAPVSANTVSGTVASVSQTEIAVQTPSGTESFALAPNVQVTGQASSLSALAPGDQVTLTLDAQGQVTTIDVTALAQTTSVSGTVASVSQTEIAVQTPSGTESFALAPNVQVTGQASSLSALAPGDQVTLTLNAQGQVTTIDVTALAQTTSVSGTVSSVSGTDITVATAAGTQVTLSLASSVSVTGQATSLAGVVPGDQVTLTVDAQGQVVTIDVTGAPSSVEGTLTAVGSGSLTVAETSPASGSVTLTLAPGVQVLVQGQPAPATALQPGEQVTVTLDAQGQVATVDVTAPPPAVGNLAGTVVAVSGQPAGVVVAVYQPNGGGYQLPTVELAPAASVTLGGQAASLGALAPGDAVQVSVDAAGQATAVAATPPPAGSVTATGVVDATGNGQLGVYETATGQQANLPEGPDPLAAQAGPSGWTAVSVGQLAIGTSVTAVSQALPGGSLLVVVRS